MRRSLLNSACLVSFLITLMLVAGCGSGGGGDEQNGENGEDGDGWDLSQGIPRFADSNYIELEKISRISRLRSGIGHDYSDCFESCRSMKHYFQAREGMALSIEIFSPVEGDITRIDQEGLSDSGSQIRIRPTGYPDFTCIIFHVALSDGVSPGDHVTSGQQLGTHAYLGCSDIAIEVEIANHPSCPWQLISYFEVMTDAVFQEYQAAGVTSREQMIISQAERDADPLNCTGETFGTPGTIENWVTLN